MSSRRRGRRTQQMEAIARERIAHLLEQAERWALEDRQDDADRCAQLARKSREVRNLTTLQAIRGAFWPIRAPAGAGRGDQLEHRKS